jgi:hypothetical protein
MPARIYRGLTRTPAPERSQLLGRRLPAGPPRYSLGEPAGGGPPPPLRRPPHPGCRRPDPGGGGGRRTHPLTGRKLHSAALIPNPSLQAIIALLRPHLAADADPAAAAAAAAPTAAAGGGGGAPATP